MSFEHGKIIYPDGTEGDFHLFPDEIRVGYIFNYYKPPEMGNFVKKEFGSIVNFFGSKQIVITGISGDKKIILVDVENRA